MSYTYDIGKSHAVKNQYYIAAGVTEYKLLNSFTFQGHIVSPFYVPGRMPLGDFWCRLYGTQRCP